MKMETEDNFLKIEEVDSFKSLKEKLENLCGNNCIFRGISDSEYKLIPSALRGEDICDEMYRKCYNIYPCRSEETDIRGQILEEFVLLFQFYKLANQQGLNIPKNEEFNHLVVINSYANEKEKKLPKKWYEPNFEDIAALAQHYGLPTRMLDWTFDPFTALYFAVIGASKHILQANKIPEQKYISIWALYSELQMICDKNLRFVIPNYSNNPNLCAQQGLLVYWHRAIEEKELLCTTEINEIDVKPLNDKIHDHLKKEHPIDLQVSKMYRYDLKYSEVPKALDYLLDRGLTAAKYFPGFDGIKRAMDEREMQYKVKKLC